MDEVVVLASFKVKKGREDEAAAAFERVAAATHQEDGCQKYAWVQALNDLTVFAVVEKWRSIEDLNTHGQTAHFAELTAAFANLMAEPPTVVLYRELGFGTADRGAL